jgi:hypothetical protein
MRILNDNFTMSSDGGRLLMDLVAGNIIHGEYGKLSPTPSRSQV